MGWTARCPHYHLQRLLRCLQFYRLHDLLHLVSHHRYLSNCLKALLRISPVFPCSDKHISNESIVTVDFCHVGLCFFVFCHFTCCKIDFRRVYTIKSGCKPCRYVEPCITAPALMSDVWRSGVLLYFFRLTVIPGPPLFYLTIQLLDPLPCRVEFIKDTQWIPPYGIMVLISRVTLLHTCTYT